MPKDIALISVQICVMTWYLELIGGIQSSDHDSEIALSSLDTYKSSFVNDLFFYVVSHDLDLQVMDEEDYEVMYEYILNEKSTTDRRRNKQAFQNNVRQVKHDSYGDAVQNLKKFHKSLRRHFGVPRVDFLDRLPSGSLQMCRASYITPVMFEQFKNLIAVNNHLTTEQKNTLKVVSILAYRTGLRIREILGLRLRDLVMIDLERNTIGYDQYYYLTSNSPNFVKILIRNNYYRQLKTPNAHRAMCLNELLTKDELRAFIDFIQKQMDHPISRKILAGKDCFIFEDEFGQLISSRFVNQVTKEIFDSLFDGQPHDFSFHSFRHTAVNNLALVLKGSNELITSWTSYMQPQIEQIKKYLLGSSDGIAGRHDVWKILAHFIGHSSIEMTANHYLHFGSLLVGDALCSDERKISASIVRTLLSSRVFKKQLNTSQREEGIDLKKIVEKLAPSSKLIQEIVYPDRFTTSVVSQKEVKVLKEVDDRHQLMASCNHIIDVLSGELSDLTITTIGKNLASKLYANRHFQHKKDTSKNNAIDVLLKHINRNRIGNLLINDNYRIINALLSSDFILDYFESHIRIIDARMEVYIKSKAEYQDFSKFLSEIRGIYGDEFKNKIKVSNISWKQIDTELKNAKSKKGVSLKIANLNYKDSTCQKIFSTIFLTYLYRWVINNNGNISNI
ncbi:tyrosine-type recombinase/integrase [Acinetobacter sp. ANC 7454]|uniref:tyrosine-type recombinase/integrase n=1 Tax=Acinetobacter thermotolerans TaxID=3151487 RepID=UPI00325A81C5